MGKRCIAAFCLMAAACVAQADTPPEFKEAEKLVVKLFDAYNKDDAKGVFTDYIAALKNSDPQTLFDALYKNTKQSVGKYKKHTFKKDGSVHADDLILLVLDAEFEKKKAKVSVNLGKEEGKWKIQQVTIEPE
jgi:hypothetical protein